MLGFHIVAFGRINEIVTLRGFCYKDWAFHWDKKKVAEALAVLTR